MSSNASRLRLGPAQARAPKCKGSAKVYEPKPVDVAAVRSRLGLTQTQFAALFGFSVATLRHWERGDRRPQGPALVLLNLIERAPLSVLQALS